MEQSKDFLATRPIGRLLLQLSLPTVAAQLINMLYNVVDRIYIGHIPGEGALALTGVGVCMPLILIISAFAALVGNGGAPRASIALGKKRTAEAEQILGNCFVTQLLVSAVLTAVVLIWNRPLLLAFGASSNTIDYSVAYMNLYALGTVFVQLTLGMNAFITAQGFAKVGMLSVLIGAVANTALDPLFIFVLGLGVRGAAIATVISQCLSAICVLYFLSRKAELRIHFLRREEWRRAFVYARDIVSLGTAGFIMQLTNSLVTICCNSVLSVTGGDIYISVMTIISSVRQLVETPIHAITEGSSPILSYNYGARRPERVKKAGAVMGVMVLAYTAVMWSLIILMPGTLISVFSTDAELTRDAIPALKQYFSAFIFMDLQYMGQVVLRSLNKRKQTIFFSLLRKVFIVVPLTYLMPYAFHMGTDGVFLAEPVSNVIGGSLCFITMLCVILPELNRMAKENLERRNS